MKGSHKHFMLKEIYEQTESLRNTMRGRVNHRTNVVKLGGIDAYTHIDGAAAPILDLEEAVRDDWTSVGGRGCLAYLSIFCGFCFFPHL